MNVAALTEHEARRLIWLCPGCKCHHAVPIEGPKAWKWNGSLETPTLEPSILVSYGDSPPPDRPAVCHCFVREGSIVFCGDSKHALAGQTVKMTLVES